MRRKHLLTLKQNLQPRHRKGLATYWLTIDIHDFSKDFSKDFQFLMNSNRTKTLNQKKIHFIIKT